MQRALPTPRRSAMRNLALTAALAFAYVVVPLLFGSKLYLMSTLIAALTIGGVALAWALLGNLGGLVSFGHAAFFGVGAYASAIAATRFGVAVPIAMLVGAVAAALSGVLMLPALRLRGPYFALAVLAYAHIFKIIATEWASLTRGAAGIGSIPSLPRFAGFDGSTKTAAYLVVLTLVIVCAVIYARIRSSDMGLALRAMHDSEDATRVVGVDSTMLKAAMLFVSAAMTGAFGAFNAHAIGFLEPDYAFSGLWTTLPIVAAIFGGYRTIVGPIAGALAVYLLDQLVFKALIPSGHQIVLGGLLVAMILASPHGLLPLLFERRPRRVDAAA